LVTAHTAADEPGPLPTPLRRSLALVAFSSRIAGSGWAFRAASLYAWAAAVTYVALGAAWAARGDDVSPGGIVARALIWISLAAGVVAWATARHVEADETRLGLDELAALRGASPPAFQVSRVLATMWLVVRAVAFPSVFLCLGLLAVYRASGGVAAWLFLVVRVTVYSLLFGIAFGGLSRVSSRLSPRHGRLVFVALVLLPEVMRSVFGDAPTLISGFGELIDLFVGQGGASA
jgi:hypothetical protein